MFQRAQYNPLTARRGARRLVQLGAAAVALAGVLGSVTVSAQTPRAPQVAAEQAPGAVAEAPPQHRAVRVIQIYNLPSQPTR